MNGSGGIARKGREKEYATELWLDGPSAFWLHPEGPLSDTTPDEWREKTAKRRRYEALRDMPFSQQQLYAGAGLLQSHAMQNQLAAQNHNAQVLGGVIGSLYRLFW